MRRHCSRLGKGIACQKEEQRKNRESRSKFFHKNLTFLFTTTEPTVCSTKANRFE
jgi:hypothetical protein